MTDDSAMTNNSYSSPAMSLSRQQDEDMRALGQALVAIADSLEIEHPSIERIRRRVVEPRRGDQVEATRRAMAENHLRSLRAAKGPPVDVHLVGDGSRVSETAHDPTEAAFEQSRVLAARGQQALRHRQMMGSQWIDSWDAHPETRPIREALYRKLAEEADR